VRHGDLVMIAVAGDYGKPRPALVIQSDAFAAHPSGTVLLLTGDIHDAPLVRSKICITIGRVPPATLTKASQALAAFLELS